MNAGGEPMPERNLLTAGEAAEYLGVHIKTVRAWADKGWLASVRWPNGWRYFRREDLDEMRVKLGLSLAGKTAAAA
jgi:excisionase family DNA binding protein